MSRYFLLGVKVEGFRGINNEGDPLSVKFKKDKISSIFAINGVGKSSLFDAIYYAITGKLPKLDALHYVERSEDYYVNRFHSRSRGTIELLFESDDATPKTHTVAVERLSDGTRLVTSPSGHPDPEALLSSFHSSFALLDYQTFNNFISNSPLERGRSFSTLLGLDVYSDFRQTLKAVADTRALNTDLNVPVLQARIRGYSDNATTSLVKLGNAYKSIFSKDMGEIDKLKDFFAEVLESLQQVELIKDDAKVASLEDIDFEAIVKTIKTAEGGTDRDRFIELSSLLTKLKLIGSPSTKIEDEKADLKTKVEELNELYESTAGKERRKLYDAADHLLDSGGWHNPNQCPLCESSLTTSIRETVTTQQDQYKQVDIKITETRQYWQISELRKRIVLLEDSVGKDIPITDKHFTSNDAKIINGGAKLSDIEELITYYLKLETRLNAAVKKFTEEYDALSKKLPKSLVQLTEQVEFAKQFHEATVDYEVNITKYNETKNDIDFRVRWQGFINKADEEYAKAETELSRQKLLTIESEYKAMFANVMGSSDVVPNLTRDDATEHLYVQLEEFRGQQDLSAKPLLSESYRNALAISVYLSAAMKHADAPRFIVLDDISSSFDAGHELNLIEYIRTKLQYGANGNGIQFIILTHDDLMQNLFERLSSSGEVHHQVIEGMPPYNLTMRSKNATQLRQNAVTPLTAGQMEVGKFWVRPYLECILMEVIRKLNISVPLDFAVQDKKRMVQNCLDAIKKDVQLHIDAGKIILTQAQIDDMKNTHVPALLSNWVSHFETGSGTSVSPAVLIGVLNSVDKFADCFKYDYTDPQSHLVTRKYYKNLSTR